MSHLDWSKCPAVERNPKRRSGALTLKNSRTMMSLVFSSIGDAGLDALCYQYGLDEEERQQIEEVLAFLAKDSEAPSEVIEDLKRQCKAVDCSK
jgi:uncharacterized protein (DUF433 family)